DDDEDRGGGQAKSDENRLETPRRGVPNTERIGDPAIEDAIEQLLWRAAGIGQRKGLSEVIWQAENKRLDPVPVVRVADLNEGHHDRRADRERQKYGHVHIAEQGHHAHDRYGESENRRGRFACDGLDGLNAGVYLTEDSLYHLIVDPLEWQGASAGAARGRCCGAGATTRTRGGDGAAVGGLRVCKSLGISRIAG